MPLTEEEQNVLWGKKGVSLSGDKLPDKYSVLEPEEKRIIQECEDEAFWYRSLPLSMSFAAGTHLLHQLTMLEIPLHFVPPGIAKAGMVLAAGVLGYGVGQMSYSNICRDKFLIRCPDGVVATDIRLKGGIQTVPYSIFSPINQQNWRHLAKQREMSRIRDTIDPGFQIDDEFKDQNILSPNLLNDESVKYKVGPVRYGVFKREELEPSDR